MNKLIKFDNNINEFDFTQTCFDTNYVIFTCLFISFLILYIIYLKLNSNSNSDLKIDKIDKNTTLLLKIFKELKKID